MTLNKKDFAVFRNIVFYIFVINILYARYLSQEPNYNGFR